MISSAVSLTDLGNDIVQITMHDRINKNTFSAELVRGLVEAYATIGESPRTKVALLTGYDTYFASGGTKEGLLAIHDGQMTFADVNMYSLALDCRIPVIAAMQGHGIGGGFVMGMYCDFVLLSRESVYTTNFMKYGFTPGMGATFILPQKLGIALAQEFLMVAGSHRGADLEKRGIPFPVLPRREVLPAALAMAGQLAEKPREALVLLKDHLVRDLRAGLAQVIRDEVRMHEQTFRGAEVAQRIEALFGK
jgi:polyketide biosynthesis enoyl-CoA hydratase PksI